MNVQRPTYAAISRCESFKHENLRLSENSIRLFQIQAGKQDDPISLRVTQFAIERRPAYKAVSYMWGSLTNSQMILVNGRSFSIHWNLWNLLHQLRQRKETSFLWADRLCIDQANFIERSFHVRFMGKIYDLATSVIVWLGLPSSDKMESRAMGFIEEIAKVRKDTSDKAVLDAYLNSDVSHRWDTLLRLCQHQYWGRLWIIQEFLRAPVVVVICAAATLNWQDFKNLILLLDRHGVRDQSMIAPLFKTRPVRLTMRREANPSSTLYELLQEYYDSECTVRRDKIYGILGLASDCDRDQDSADLLTIKPDYRKHIVGVYLDTVMCIDSTLTSKFQTPSVINLVRRTLHLTHQEFVQYMNDEQTSSLTDTNLIVMPDYIGVIANVTVWTSVGDLRQKLQQIDWGEFVGYEVKSSRPGFGRRSSARAVHSSLPSNFIQNTVNVAEMDPEITLLHNYPPILGLRISKDHMMLDDVDKCLFMNTEMRKPPVFVEQAVGDSSIRLGFGCTNTRNGDLLLQFRGLNEALVVRSYGSQIHLVGKAVVISHCDIENEYPLDPICTPSPWFSSCPRDKLTTELQIESDAISLAELLSRE